MIDDFVESLRRAGMRLPTTAVMDLHRTAGLVGVASKTDLRDALRSVAVRNGDDRQIFDHTFDAFFDLRASMGSDGSPAVDDESHRRMLDALRARGLAESAAAVGALLAGGAVLESWLRDAAGQVGLGDMGHGMQTGLYTQRILRQARFDQDANASAALERALTSALGSDDASALLRTLATRRAAAARFVRALVTTEFERRNPLRIQRWRRDHVQELDFRRLDVADARRLEDEVTRLVSIMKGRLAMKRKRHRGRRLDGRATARAALRTGGVPFRPVFRRPRPHGPDLVLLCDISESVRFVSRLFLSLVHALQGRASRVRSFVFVGHLGEATELFRTLPLPKAVAAAHGGAVVSTAAMTDYGAALTELVSHHAAAITRHTTVVILGDARSNRLDPALAALASMASRAQRVLWFNPEPRSSWGTGDSVMAQYLPYVNEALVVNNLQSLRKAVDRLVRPT